MELLFQNVTVVTMDDADTVLENVSLGVRDGRIAHIGPPPESGAARVIDASGHVLMPGLINAHTHLPMTLLRGYADDLVLQDWLFNHIFPAEDKMTDDMVYWGTLLAAMECLQGGTISVTDMYNHEQALARAVAESGLMANLCRPLQCFDAVYDPQTDSRLAELRQLHADWHGHDNGRIRIDAGIHAEYTSPPAVWETAAAFARDNSLGLHVHISETATEHNECLARHGLTPTAVLARHGVFSVPVNAAHCVHVTDDDLDILARHGATAVHNPVSNLKLDSGVARVAAWRSRGVNVALGTDGVASNNSHDMFEEIKQAAILHHGESPLTAKGALRLATEGGARAQRRAAECGRIAVGLDADMILLDFNRAHLVPRHNTLSLLAYAARGSDVVMTLVRGRVLYDHGSFTAIDAERVLFEVERIRHMF